MIATVYTALKRPVISTCIPEAELLLVCEEPGEGCGEILWLRPLLCLTSCTPSLRLEGILSHVDSISPYTWHIECAQSNHK